MILSAILTLLIVVYFSVIGSKPELSDWFLAVFLLFFSIDELRRAVLILVKKQNGYVFIARLGFFIFRLIRLPSKTYNALLKNYQENVMKTASIFTVIGSILFIWISISIFVS